MFICRHAPGFSGGVVSSLAYLGDVTLNGSAASVGTTIDVYVGSDTTPSGSCTITIAGQYGAIQVFADDSRFGEALTYKVNGLIAQKIGPDTGVFSLQNQEVNLVAVSTSAILCWGTVTLNGVAAPVGTVVEIYMGDDNTPTASTTVSTYGGSYPPGTYGSAVVRAEVSRYGEALTYKVNGFMADKLGPDAGVFGLANQVVNLAVVLGIGQEFIGNPRSCDSTPCCVTFTNLVTGGALPYKHATWDFGDGTVPVIDQAIQYGQIVTHCYQKAGIFDVTLTLTDANDVVAYLVEFDYITVGGFVPGNSATWSLYDPGFFPQHLPDSYFNSVWLPDLVDVPSEVQAVYWWDKDADIWRFWGPGGVPGTTLDHLVGGLYADYMVSVTGACEWEIPLP